GLLQGQVGVLDFATVNGMHHLQDLTVRELARHLGGRLGGGGVGRAAAGDAQDQRHDQQKRLWRIQKTGFHPHCSLQRLRTDVLFTLEVYCYAFWLPTLRRFLAACPPAPPPPWPDGS